MTESKLKSMFSVSLVAFCINHDELDFVRDYFREKEIDDYVFFTVADSKWLHVKALFPNDDGNLMFFLGQRLNEWRKKDD